jgi:hypothetical protein
MERKDSFVFWNSKYRVGIFLKKGMLGMLRVEMLRLLRVLRPGYSIQFERSTLNISTSQHLNPSTFSTISPNWLPTDKTHG